MDIISDYLLPNFTTFKLCNQKYKYAVVQKYDYSLCIFMQIYFWLQRDRSVFKAFGLII